MRSISSILTLLLPSSLLFVACGDDLRAGNAGRFVRDVGFLDAGKADAGSADLGNGLDLGSRDLGSRDEGLDMGPPSGGDMGPRDMGMDRPPDAGPEDMGRADVGPDGGTPAFDGGRPQRTSMQIDAVRTVATGASNLSVSPSLPIRGALVTYVLPTGLNGAGDPPGGFFLQSEPAGPALFVQTTTVAASVSTGDIIDLDVTEVDDTNGLRQVTGFLSLRILASGQAALLVQDVSSATDLVSNLSAYEGEAISISGTFSAERVFAGRGYQSLDMNTPGLAAAGRDLRLRLPETVASVLEASADCTFTASGVMWRFQDVAQPSAWRLADIQNVSCPLSAMALSPTEVVLNLGRNIDPASVRGDGSQFSIPGLTVSGAAVSGRQVTLTTSGQMGTLMYSVSVAGTVTDVTGSAISAPNNTATFNGFSQVGVSVLLNEVYYDSPGGDGPNVFTELYGPAGTDLTGWTLVGVNGGNGSNYRTVTLMGTIPSDGFYVVARSDAVGPALTARDFVGDVDWQNGAPDAVQLYDPAGGLVDALQYGAGALMAGEGAPAADVSGMSLTRDAAHTDTDDNATDFSSAMPTPGS